MSNWQTELTTGIQDFRRKFEGAEEHVGNRPMVKREYDQALARLREAEVAVSAFVDVYDDGLLKISKWLPIQNEVAADVTTSTP